MDQQDDAANQQYPHGRGYGHDYMRGGEVFDGYGYAQREEYARPRGDLLQRTGGNETAESTDDELHRSQ